jgi:hypothetical protein
MSNELITYSTALPDFLKEAGGYRDEGMTAGIAPKAPKLSMTTSKQWTISDNGVTTMLETQVQDGQGKTHVIPSPSVKGVIIASSGTLTKAWYEKAFVPGTNAAPDCFSNDGKVPAPGVAKPQCANCAQCPKNAFGSHPTTGRGKACGDRKLIVLALDSMPDKFATFNVPTMSLASLRAIDGQLKSSNIPLQSVMMEFSFDPSIQYPVVKIGAIGFIGKEHFEKFRDAADSDEVSQLLREVDYEAPAETAQAPVVPNNQIAFGTGGQTVTTVEEPKEPELTPKQKAAAALKAQLAALEAEEDDDEAATTHTQTQQTSQAQQQSVESAGILGGGQANTTTTATTGAAAPAKRTRRSKAEMEAARAAEAAQQQQLTGASPLEQGVAQTLQQEAEPEAQQAQTPAPTVNTTGAPNVLDLLSKWASK